MKKCKECGREYKEELLFCDNCGCSEIVEVEIVPQESVLQKENTYSDEEKEKVAKKKKFTFGRIILIMGILVGAFAIYMGYDLYTSTGYYLRNDIAFGADFYTEIYATAESIRGNTRSLTNAVYEGLGMLMMFCGATDICAFGYVLATDIQKK